MSSLSSDSSSNSDVGPISQSDSLGLLGRQRGSRSFRNQTPLFLSKRHVKVQHELIRIDPKLGNNEWHLLRNQVGDEGDVSGANEGPMTNFVWSRSRLATWTLVLSNGVPPRRELV